MNKNLDKKKFIKWYVRFSSSSDAMKCVHRDNLQYIGERTSS